jgi:uncharacterized repeat protein (TIGR03803 family)
MRSKKPFSAGKPSFVIFIMLLLASAIGSTQAQAQKFKVLHTFHGKDGAFPVTQLTRDGAGNLYGTTSEGGTGVCTFGSSKVSCGTTFKLDRTGKQVWLHSFQYGGGESPMAGLLRDRAGNLYGTTVYGGTNGSSCGEMNIGCGVVFKLDKTGKETVLHRFKGGASDGQFPEALLIQDSAGNLYGTTIQGGEHEEGTAFMLNKAGKETILFTFYLTDGQEPFPGVISDTAGNLYGTTADGGSCGDGTVFELSPGAGGIWTETVLHDFCGGDGAIPSSVLIWDDVGNLYGTTDEGGSSVVCGGGCGTVFELSPGSGGNWTEKVLYSFCSVSGCADGENPDRARLVRDAAGNLFGTTVFGGASRCGGSGCGVVFKLDPSGKETVLHSFTGGSDGNGPADGLTIDNAGNLYGTAEEGGDLRCNSPYGCGTVFEVAP